MTVRMSEPQSWWADVDGETLQCLVEHGPMSPEELGKRLGMSAHAAVALLGHLVREGKARICLVAAA